MKRMILFWTMAVFFLAFHGTGMAQANNTARVNVQVSMAEAGPQTIFTAALDGSQENPPVTTPAKGTGVFVLDSKGLSYRVTLDGMSGPITASHFHNAAVGTNGGVVQPVTFDGNTSIGAWEIPAAMRTELLAGHIYVNVHTAANPGGEIRGQLTPVAGTAFWADVDWGQEFPGPASVTPPATATAPTVDRVGYPEGYRTWKLLHEFDRQDNRQRRAVYANDRAASATPGQPYPYGSVLVLETQATVHDPLGNVMRDAGGRFIPSSAAPTVFVMRKEQGFGADYKDIRNGEWEYAQYRADKSRVAPNATTGGTQSCATCHLAAGDPKKDFVFRDGQDFSRKSRGTAVFWMDGSSLRYRATVSGLSGAITASNFHNAANNANGPAVQPVTMDGATTSGAWAIPAAMATELKSGRLYLNFRTAANPNGEVRGQILPISVLGGLEVNFTRTVSGKTLEFAWKGVTDEQGKATVSITTKEASASGYYRARIINTKTRTTVSDWASIPVRGGRMIDLALEIGGQAAIVGPFFGTPLASTKPVVGPPTVTVLSGVEPMSPALSFGSAEKRKDGGIDLPVQIADAKDMVGGDLALTYDPALLTFRAGRIGNTGLTVTESGPGSVSLAFEGLAPADQTGLVLSFDRRTGDALGDLKLTGFLYDRNLIPISEVAAEALLNGVAPKDYALFQNAPNPFNPATAIRYALPQAGQVRLTIYNALGQQVARLVDVRQEAGAYSVTWDARDFASGTYYYRLEAGTFREVKKLVLIK
ncbi:MAG: CHRD domain-containing protein [Candidatus Latescibacteria bacterium]|nr:CHRD domain-containing protein [Candidatus Latescibacterota bacterium]